MRTKVNMAIAASVAIVGLSLVFSEAAHAGTTYLNFDPGVGLLTYKYSGSGELTTSEGRALFTGPCVVLLAEDGSPVVSSGVNTVKMTLTPYTDAGTAGVGVIMMDASDSDVYLTATVSSDGIVTLMDSIGTWENVAFDYPAAANNLLTVTHDTTSDQATLNINDSAAPADTVTLYNALYGAMSVHIGVFASGSGFELFEATGSGVPDYIQQEQVDSDGDGLLDEVETNTGTFVDENDTGTDPNNPDTDGDHLSDGDEVNQHGTDPNNPDSDGDDMNDGFEMAFGTDPGNPAEFLELPAVIYPGLVVLATLVATAGVLLIVRKRRTA